jgi:hypothetical protein
MGGKYLLNAKATVLLSILVNPEESDCRYPKYHQLQYDQGHIQ